MNRWTFFHDAYKTEQTYCDWIVRYIKFHGVKIHPVEDRVEPVKAKRRARPPVVMSQ